MQFNRLCAHWCTQHRAHTQANNIAPLFPHWNVFEKGALSFGAATTGQKQTYWSIPVYNFLIFLFCYSEKKSPQTPVSKHADAQRREKWKMVILPVCARCCCTLSSTIDRPSSSPDSSCQSTTTTTTTMTRLGGGRCRAGDAYGEFGVVVDNRRHWLLLVTVVDSPFHAEYLSLPW